MGDNKDIPTITRTTAGIIVTGDDVIKGHVTDTNSHFAASKLYKQGINLKKITIISDDIQEIRDEVRLFSKKYDYVIISGGTGIEANDVTYEGVAKAFNDSLQLNADNKAVPKSSDTLQCYVQGSYQYVQKIKNVYMFSGTPNIFEKTFNWVLNDFNPLLYIKGVYFKKNEENRIEEFLTKQFSGHDFFSFLSLKNSNHAKVIMKSRDPKVVTDAYKKLLASFPTACVISLETQD